MLTHTLPYTHFACLLHTHNITPAKSILFYVLTGHTWPDLRAVLLYLPFSFFAFVLLIRNLRTGTKNIDQLRRVHIHILYTILYSTYSQVLCQFCGNKLDKLMFCLTLRLINGKPFTGLHLVFFFSHFWVVFRINKSICPIPKTTWTSCKRGWCSWAEVSSVRLGTVISMR